MHPEDVAELVAAEFGDLQAELVGREDLPVSEARLVGATRIQLGFTARQQASEVVESGIAVPHGAGEFQVQGMRVPILGRATQRDLVLAVGCENWDGTPPSAELLLPDGTPLPPNEWPQDEHNRGIVFGHPEYDRKFFCRRGFREYHSHPVHKDDPWDEHREGASLAGLVLGLLGDLVHRWTMRAA